MGLPKKWECGFNLIALVSSLRLKGETYEGDGAEEVYVVGCSPFFGVAICNPCHWTQGSVIDD